MNITLPIKLNSTGQVTIEAKSFVIVGANGSGKTRFGTDIENRYNQQTHRISAQKSLSMPNEVSPKSKLRAESEFLYGYFDEHNPSNLIRYKHSSRWGQNPNTYLLNDFDKLMVLLHTEEYEESIKFKESYNPGQADQKPITKLDRVQRIWEYVLPHRKLIKKAGSIETYPADNHSAKYNASEMSDGERVIFYLLGEIVSAPVNSIIVVDEPEMHIHKSITKRLWDIIEQERTDCTFVYLTHDIDFASSRQDSVKIWAKSFNGTQWDYDVLESNLELPEQLYLEILGSRKPILFIEGDDSSIDYKLLQLVYTDYTIKPLGSCIKVFETTKSFNEQKGFHNITSFGLIDRDRRTDEEISSINNPNIWVAKVAEIENFLIIEEVIRIVASAMLKNPDDVFQLVKSNVISFFNTQIEKQALEHTISRVERIFKTSTNNALVKTFTEFEDSLNTFWHHQNFHQIYIEILDLFRTYVNSENYPAILRVFNNKGLIHNSDVVSLCDLNSKNNAYLNYILGILKQNNDHSMTIKTAIINYIE
jgi:ABC-type dipeptide/oligopeptide/nickel transport system ATPase component